MKHLSTRKKQIIALFVFSVLISAAAIIHGIFFDMDFNQIERLTFEGFIFTLLVFFPTLIFMEWLFEWNNNDKMKTLEQKIEKLEKALGNTRKKK
ncbi:MAG: hypothetical protein PHU63_00425 [Candidatus ainarchaeum sp.]|nr:hypothetical protein [Candidatus ainarchaeum sp.]